MNQATTATATTVDNGHLQLLSVKGLGRLLGFSERLVNHDLEALGLQRRFDEGDAQSCWLLTKAGEAHGCYLKATDKGPDVRELLWFASVVGLIRERAVRGYHQTLENTA